MVMRQHNVWCVCVAFCVERYAGIMLEGFLNILILII